MRKINKLGPTEEFEEFVRDNKPKIWDNLSKNNKELLRSITQYILKNEQNNICGYTEVKLKNNSKYKVHIDHYYKKGLSKGKKQYHFDWNNLIVAIYDNNKEFGACHKDEIINNISQYTSFFNPINDNCQDYYKYSNDGKIIPKIELEPSISNKANKTIEIFNLNHKDLVNLRRDTLIVVKAFLIGSKGCDIDSLKSQIFEYYGFHSLIEPLFE